MPIAPARPLAPSARLVDFALLLVAALLLRAPYFGDPGLHVDEQFYLMVGERMLDGALPYVDIWDRKPLGLFLIYAIAALTPGTSILAYQLLATTFAVATAGIVYGIADRLAGRMAGLAAGLFYLVWLVIFQGWGGQSPVFYNLFVAAAAALTIDALARPTRSPAATFRRGAAIMLLLGVAIQVKYTVVFEGMAMGLALLWRLARVERCGVAGFARAAAGWIIVALAPTLAALAAYAALGHGDAFIYANFVSIFEKASESGAQVEKRLVGTMLLLAPLTMLGALFGWRHARHWRRLDAAARQRIGFVGAWVAAAVAGYLSVGNLYYHYALPLLPPLCVAAGAGLAGLRTAPLFAAAIALYGAAIGTNRFTAREATLGSGADIPAIASAIVPHLRDGCLFVYEGPPILYELTGACAPTRYSFPYHLSIAIEAAALGVDPAAETRRIFATRPTVVVDTTANAMAANETTRSILRAELARDYARVARIRYGERFVLVYARKPR